MKPISLEKLGEMLGAPPQGDPQTVVSGVSSLDFCRPGTLVMVESKDQLDALSGTEVAAVLLSKLDVARAAELLGKLPGDTVKYEYDLEYGTDTIEIQADAVEKGQRVVVLDDLLATGGTMAASIELLNRVGADVVGTACIIELTFLGGRDRLGGVPFDTLMAYDD